MGEEVIARQGTDAREFAEGVFARFDALDERARRAEAGLKLMRAKIEAVISNEQDECFALMSFAEGVNEVKLLAERIERRLTTGDRDKAAGV